MWRRAMFAVGLALVVMRPSLFAQARLTGADLRGTVTDPSGGLVPGCAVMATNLETNVARSVSTDSQGRYNVPGLSPGIYTISAARSGFKTQVREGVALLLGDAVTVDFSLPVAEAAETVIVAGDSSLLSPIALRCPR